MGESACWVVPRTLAADPGPVALDGELLGATLVELSDERPALIRALPGG